MPVWQNEQLSVQPVAFGDVDGLDLGGACLMPAPRQAQEPFPRSVRRDLLGDDLRPVERVGGGELAAQILGDVGHGVERGDAVRIEPGPKLADAHPPLALGHADGRQRGAQACAVEPGEGRPGRCRGGRLGRIFRRGRRIEDQDH